MKWDTANLISQVRTVCKITPDGCWTWRYGSWAGRDLDTARREYPRLMIGGRRQSVARWVLEAATGPVSEMEPCHSCDRPACVAPAHLRWDTHKGNMADMGSRRRSGAQQYPELYAAERWQRIGAPPGDAHPLHRNPGLAARGEQHGSKTHPERWARGERQGSAKLTADKVRDIRLRLADGQANTDIGVVYGVGRGTIRAIAEGRTWRHVA